MKEEAASAYFLPKKFFYYPVVESTSDTVYALLLEGAPAGTVVIANKQVKGRGRWGRVWVSPEGKGLYTSFVLPVSVWPLPAERFTLCIAYSVAEALEGMGHIAVSIRWPNDIICDGKKLAGILTERRICADKEFFITGIGVNISFAGSEMPQGGINLQDKLCRSVEIMEVAEEIFSRIDQDLCAVKNGKQQYIESGLVLKSTCLHKPVEITLTDNSVRRGIAVGFTEEGALLFKDGQGMTEIIHSSHVESLREL